MTIVVTGGSGFIGTALARVLLEQKHTVIVVDIKPPTFTHEKLFYINCDLSKQPLPYNVLDRTDAVIHLVGSKLVQKWDDKTKEDIKSSRIESTKRVVEGIKLAESRPTVFICASAIGFYGDTKDSAVDEQGDHGEGFLAETVALWEAEAREAVEYGVRVVCVRTSPVLGKNRFLSLLTKTAPFRFLLKISKKDFWMSWIHEQDVVAVYLFALETSTLQGVVNATAPESVLQSTFFQTLAKALKIKFVGTAPRFIMKMMYGELVDEITKNQKIEPKRLMDKGFQFKYPTLESALNEIYKK